jgi:hypothetical protein
LRFGGVAGSVGITKVELSVGVGVHDVIEPTVGVRVPWVEVPSVATES